MLITDRQIAEWLVRADTTWSVQIDKASTTATSVLIYVDGDAHQDHDTTKLLLYTWMRDDFPDDKPVLLPVAGEMVMYQKLWVQGISQDGTDVKMIVRYQLDPKKVYTFNHDEDHTLSQTDDTDDGRRFSVLGSLELIEQILSALLPRPDPNGGNDDDGRSTDTSGLTATGVPYSHLTQNLRNHAG